jgi:hypothetical protein
MDQHAFVKQFVHEHRGIPEASFVIGLEALTHWEPRESEQASFGAVKIRLVKGIRIAGAVSDQQFLIAIELDLLQTDDLVRAMLQFLGQREQAAACVWHVPPEAVKGQ